MENINSPSLENMHSPSNELVWQDFFKRLALTSSQTELFKRYYEFLVTTNDVHNLTAITKLERVLTDHFEDSLALREHIDCMKLASLGDVGTGAGFPAIPLKIVYPHLRMTLIEVNQKKVAFLHELIDLLQLENCEVMDLDWRTFLRKTADPIDLFCARASLQPEELVRLFKPSSAYQDAQLVYWASQSWVAPTSIVPFIERDEPYEVGDKKRRLIFFAR